MDQPDNSKYAKIAVVSLLALAAIATVVLNLFGTPSPEALTAQAAVQMPAQLNQLIQIGIIALLTAGFSWVFKVFGLDLRGQAPVLGLALSAWVVTEFQNILNTLPETYDPWLDMLFRILIVILAPAGGLWLLNRKKEDQPQALL